MKNQTNTQQKLTYFKNLLSREKNPAKKAFFTFRIEVLEEIVNNQEKKNTLFLA